MPRGGGGDVAAAFVATEKRGFGKRRNVKEHKVCAQLHSNHSTLLNQFSLRVAGESTLVQVDRRVCLLEEQLASRLREIQYNKI